MALWDYKLDDTTGDMVLPITIIYGAEAVKQKLRIALGIIQGESFMDSESGLPIGSDLADKINSSSIINSEIKRIIMTVTGVLSIVAYESSYNATERKHFVAFYVNHEDEGIIGYADAI